MYQGSKGGMIYSPMDIEARLIRSSSPLLSKQISSKYVNMSACKVQRDMEENHNRHFSQDYIRKLSQEVGNIVEAEESLIQYSLPPEVIGSESVGLGRDGTTMYIRKDGYRETMSGTISFYDVGGNRGHTIYVAQSPEYGKSGFNERFTREIGIVKSLLSKKEVTCVGLADGAADNWTYLKDHSSVEILDYWHATEYLTKASKASSKSYYERRKWFEQSRTKLKTQKNGANDLLAEMKKFRRKKNLSKIAKTSLEKAITYFTNHKHQMKYADYLEKNYPIGSGVTEAACKVVVKERMCQSGMKWTLGGSQKTLAIRALWLTNGRWKQFWNHIDQYGFSQN